MSLDLDIRHVEEVTAPVESVYASAVRSRPNVLPPRWDGRPVAWTELTPDNIFICVMDGSTIPAHDPCPTCGCRDRLIAKGTIAPGVARNRAGVAMIHSPNRLTALRCLGCARDWIIDSTGETWDIEPDDYADAGSFA